MLKSQARREVLQVLGLLACAREPLTLREFRQFFGPETADRMEDLLTIAAEFFGSRPAGRAPDAPFRFFHTSFQEFILEQSADLQADLHAQLADACLRWRELDEPAHLYALCHLPAHLREVKRWEDLVNLLGDLQFLGSTAKRFRWKPPFPLSYRIDSIRLTEFLHDWIDPIPKELISKSQKLLHMAANLEHIAANPESFAKCLALYYTPHVGGWDKQARCTCCGEDTIAHGYREEGGWDSWDYTYFSLCVNCSWFWYGEYRTTMDPGIPEFDYATNTYK